MGNKKIFVFPLLFSLVFLMSCLSGLDPVSSDVKDISMSLSIPVGKAEIGLAETFPIGLPNNQAGVPPWAMFDTIGYSDTLAVDLSKIYDKSKSINYLEFRINVWNEFPVSCIVQSYFTDANGDELYLFENNKPLKITKSDIILNGNIIHPSYSWSYITFDKNQIESLSTKDYLVFNARIILKDSYDYTWKFTYFDRYKMTCQVAARVDFVLNDI